ncbi:helix-turn-helix domain-containing protein [Pelagibacterium xiamenense]|uniref:helix-turn-helix domain-containing protein n=1 Tax=Pelagibacterium xiamenense TaxID=2901140 RepID=UPI001E2E2B09|nr:helix-turn-helix domain-containing protein [Pelagibacterium xiamenense]MCD7060247.1 helix-turn-helix domain-containing protein [Pelagibacterium xiamenense]
MKTLDISEVSERTGIAPSTLRYYEEIGLIASVARHGLRRQFDDGVLARLSLIALGKAAGFPLSEISRMVREDGTPALPRASLHAKADDLDRRIRELTALRNLMRHVAECPAPSHMECDSFRRLLSIAHRRARSSVSRTRKHPNRA